jgi:lambda family phage minor tail protein L
MARDLSALFREETTKTEQGQLYHLITFVDIPTTPEPTSINIVDANEDVIYDGVTYIKFPVIFNGIEMTGTGEISKASLVVANPERTFQAYLQQFKGLRGIRVEVKTVFERFLDSGESPDPLSCVEDSFIIDSYTATDQTIQFQLDPVCDFSIKIPRRRFTHMCYWRFKDPETCMYAGAESTCTKDLDSCRQKGNEARFGGFPGIPTQTRRINF